MQRIEESDVPPNLAALREAMREVGVEDLEVCTWESRYMLRGCTTIHWGKYAGTEQRVGWSFPDNNQPFPEYGPHWFHVAGEFDDGNGGAKETDLDEHGNPWVCWSRPIGSSWTGPNRTPKNLYRFTVARFWKAAK